MRFHFGGASRRGVVLLLLGLFVLPAVGYSADPYSLVLEGYEAYEAKDYARARARFDQACKGGDALGCSNLGFMFLKGKGGEQNKAQARALYNQACKGGDAAACYNLGVMFETGEGGPLGLARARELYDQACKGGVAQAC